jgi:hypothetical protein
MITILDVKREKGHSRFSGGECETQERPLGLAVAATEGEIADTVGYGTALIGLQRLEDVWVVPYNDIGAEVHSKAGHSYVFVERLFVVGEPPMKGRDDAIKRRPEALEVALKIADRRPGTSRETLPSGCSPVPIVVQECNGKGAVLVGIGLIRIRFSVSPTYPRDAILCENVERLLDTFASAVGEVVVS